MLKKKLIPTIVLACICLVVALLLAAVNSVTKPIIIKAQEEKVQKALSEVLPSGANFVEISIDGMPDVVTKAFTEDGGGYVFQMTVTGYKPGLIVMCGIDADGKITGAKYIASNETLSAEVGLGDKFVGFDKSSINVDIIAGPTAKLTTRAYYKAIEAALDAYDFIKEDSAK